MRYRKEEPPRRTPILQRGLVESGHCGNSNTLNKNLVNTPIKAQGKIIGYYERIVDDLSQDTQVMVVFA